MANLPELNEFTAGVYQIETSDPVLGGVEGITNVPLKALANRTKWLKDQVDALVASVGDGVSDADLLAAINKLPFKAPAAVATTTNITLSGLQTIDGVALTAGQRVLVKNQSTAAQNGIWLAQTSAWTRADDMNEDAEVTPGMAVVVSGGTNQADTVWLLSTDGTVTVGTSPMAFKDITGEFAKLASPAFTGNPTGPTAAQFDNDTNLATTEFVQRALGNARGFAGFTTNTTLTAAHAGREIYASATAGAITLTLPAANALPAGAKFHIINTGVSDVIVSRAGTDTIVVNNTTNTVTAVTLRSGDSIVLTSLGTGNLWYHGGGSAQLGVSGLFGASLTANGWQRLPSGLILQWGITTTIAAGGNQVVTFPIAFPTAFAQAWATPATFTQAGSFWISPTTATQMTVNNGNTGTSISFRWFAIGW